MWDYVTISKNYHGAAESFTKFNSVLLSVTPW